MSVNTNDTPELRNDAENALGTSTEGFFDPDGTYPKSE